MQECLVEDGAVQDLADEFARGTPPNLCDNWHNAALIVQAHHHLARQAIDQVVPYPDWMQGRGIVICAGGRRLFTNAWVCVRMLRRAGCRLPVQFWHLGESELDEPMRRLVAEYDVECVDAEQIRQLFPARTLWHACEVEYRNEPEFESGQVVVDKQRCWTALNLAMHYNEHSDFYYLHFHGDKETFHLAFHRVDKSYAMPARAIHALDATMCQHDFQGRRIFQHRNMDKWEYDGSNRRVAGFIDEDVCREFLAELRDKWNGRVLWNETPSSTENLVIQQLGGKLFDYVRIGYDSRHLELRPDRTVGRGSEEMERRWTVLTVAGQLSLVLHGQESPTCRLTLNGGSWHGRWYRHERMPISMAAVDDYAQRTEQACEGKEQHDGR